MDAQYRVQRLLCQAQYGDILLCEVAAGAMKPGKSDDVTDSHQIDHDIEWVVVKQISWSRLQAVRPQIGSAPLQIGDDPMLEVDVAAKICAAGSHKNVVRYHKVLRGDQGSLGVVMEYCNEGDLLGRLDELPNNRMSEADALVVLRQVAHGLSFLHNIVGIAHRDISLENVMLRDGVCKIGDFGLSVEIEYFSQSSACQRRTVEGRVGKLGYMAPEVAEGKAYDPVVADIWSLGVLFFILLTGSPLVELASVDCPGFRAFCRLGLRRVLTNWKMIDDFHEATIDLINSMLQVDPHERITLQQVLNHSALSS